MEIFEDLADVDSVFVAVGGGGLIGGIAAYLKSVKPGIKVKGLNEEGKCELQGRDPRKRGNPKKVV